MLKAGRYLLIFSLLVLITGVIVSFTSYRPILPGYHAFYYTPQKYNELKKSLKKEKKTLRESFRKIRWKNDKETIRKNIRNSFRSMMAEKIFPFWYGTFWSFHGTSEVPGQSSIACGYFVTTTLRDVGCKIDRTHLAQVSSEEMIKSLVKEKYILRFSNSAYEQFVEAMKNEGPGVYVVGLDNHTGFWVNHNDQSWFIHSSGTLPFCVVKERGDNSGVLRKSKYRVVGLLTKDDSFIEKWVQE